MVGRRIIYLMVLVNTGLWSLILYSSMHSDAPGIFGLLGLSPVFDPGLVHNLANSLPVPMLLSVWAGLIFVLMGKEKIALQLVIWPFILCLPSMILAGLTFL